MALYSVGVAVGSAVGGVSPRGVAVGRGVRVANGVTVVVGVTVTAVVAVIVAVIVTGAVGVAVRVEVGGGPCNVHSRSRIPFRKASKFSALAATVDIRSSNSAEVAANSFIWSWVSD